MSLHCGTVCGGGVQEGTMPLPPLSWLSVTSPASHKQIGPFWCCFLNGWVCVCSRPLWVSPVNSPGRLGVSPAAASTPTGVFNQRFEALFPDTGTLGCVVCFAPPAVPPGLSTHDCGTAGSGSHYHVGSDSYSLACPIPQTSTLLGPPAAALP